MQNQATLTGYLGKDAGLRTTRNQTPFAVLSLATHRSWKDRNSGERQTVAEWHRCVVFGRLANYAGTLTKGTHVQLEGEIHTRQYTPRVVAEGASNGKRSMTKIRVFRIMNLDRPAKPGLPPCNFLRTRCGSRHRCVGHYRPVDG